MDCRILGKSRIKHAVKNSLLGLISLNDETALFDFGNVVVQKSYTENNNVRIVSGGNYCTGPFVGKGMLTCAIEGEYFMAPTSKTILRTLRELSYDHLKGILIIVPSNSGNLLNFGVAIERALNDNIRVKLLPVKDNCKNNDLPRLEKNGLSGFLLISKVAGAMSERQFTLNDIQKFCEVLAYHTVSIGFNSSDLHEDYDRCICSKGKPDSYSVTSEQRRTSLLAAEFSQSSLTDTIYSKTLGQLIEVKEQSEIEPGKVVLIPKDVVVILLNNNGVLGKTEELLFVYDTVKFLQNSGIIVARFYVNNNVKLNNDLIITIAKVHDKDVLKYLDDPCTAFGWQAVNQCRPDGLSFENILPGRLTRKERLAPPIRGPRLSSAEANTLLFATQFACDALISCEHQLNTIDAERGNGNTGTRLHNVAEVLIKRMKQNKLITEYPFTFFESLGKMLEGAIGGTSGCIYSMMFEAAASSFTQYHEMTTVTPQIWLQSFENAAHSIKKYGSTEYGENTMYDPIIKCLETVHEALGAGVSTIMAFEKGLASADLEISKTKENYKYPDSGAHAVGIWMRAAFEGVKLRCR